MRLTATCPAGLEPALEQEWRTLGVTESVCAPGSVSVAYDPRLLYVAHENLRSASRLLLELAQGPAQDARSLYDFMHSIAWEQHFLKGKTLAVRATGSNRELRHSRFIAQQSKDAIVDRLRARAGHRPDVDLQSPDLRAFVHVHANQAWAGIDVSGEGLHRRGYRQAHAQAPLRENLAAGLLILSGWLEHVDTAQVGEDILLFDPMCGSGTLVLEAILIASRVTPGACRRAAGQRSGFDAWAGYQESTQRDALASKSPHVAGNVRVHARDLSADATNTVERTLRELQAQHGLRTVETKVDRGDFFSSPSPILRNKSLLISNPPYGERLGGHVDEAKPMYRRIGDTLKQRYAGWDAWILCGNKSLAKSVGLRAEEGHTVLHGGIDARFCRFPIHAATETALKDKPKRARDAEARMFENRLLKNWKKRRRLAAKQKTTAFRVYDRDIPEFNLSVDWYDGYVRVEERERPRNIAEHDADRRRRNALEVVRDVLDVARDAVTFRVRSREQGQQDQRVDADDVVVVEERELRFEVNLQRYLDTGLFLDGAEVRQWIRERAKDCTFLNLFSYTCAASIAAAKGGARVCTNVDLSKTALGWGARNAKLNHCREYLRFVHHDVVPWLEQSEQRFDLVYAGVPSYSASRQAREPFDAVRGQHAWLPLMMRQVAKGGLLILSVHARDFRPDADLTKRYKWEDRSASLVPEGFRKSPRSQQVFLIKRC